MYEKSHEVCFSSFLLLSIFPSLQSQESSYLIDSLHIKGNTRTKEYIITKELDFRTGDSLFDCGWSNIWKNKNRLLGTALFVNADFNISEISVETKKLRSLFLCMKHGSFFHIFILNWQTETWVNGIMNTMQHSTG